jgi:hypothetical protein
MTVNWLHLIFQTRALILVRLDTIYNGGLSLSKKEYPLKVSNISIFTVYLDSLTDDNLCLMVFTQLTKMIVFFFINLHILNDTELNDL